MNDSLLVIVLADAVLYGTPLLLRPSVSCWPSAPESSTLGVEGMMLFGAVVGFG